MATPMAAIVILAKPKTTDVVTSSVTKKIFSTDARSFKKHGWYIRSARREQRSQRGRKEVFSFGKEFVQKETDVYINTPQAKSQEDGTFFVDFLFGNIPIVKDVSEFYPQETFFLSAKRFWGGSYNLGCLMLL